MGGLIAGLPTAAVGCLFRLGARIAAWSAIVCGSALCLCAASAWTWDWGPLALGIATVVGAYAVALGIAVTTERHSGKGEGLPRETVRRALVFPTRTFARPWVSAAMICMVVSLVGVARRAYHAKAEESARRRILELRDDMRVSNADAGD
jgi:hypothetical protein